MLNDLADFNANMENLIEEDNIMTVKNAVTDGYNLSASVNDNFKELERACPEWQPDTQAIHPKWFEHHQSGHLTKDKKCSVCVEEAGSRVAYRARREIANRESCMLTLPHSNPLQMATRMRRNFTPTPSTPTPQRRGRETYREEGRSRKSGRGKAP